MNLGNDNLGNGADTEDRYSDALTGDALGTFRGSVRREVLNADLDLDNGRRGGALPGYDGLAAPSVLDVPAPHIPVAQYEHGRGEQVRIDISRIDITRGETGRADTGRPESARTDPVRGTDPATLTWGQEISRPMEVNNGREINGVEVNNGLDFGRLGNLPVPEMSRLDESVFDPPSWLDSPSLPLADHPLLRGLLLELPNKGPMPSAEWLDRWFEAARSILELLYSQSNR